MCQGNYRIYLYWPMHYIINVYILIYMSLKYLYLKYSYKL